MTGGSGTPLATKIASHRGGADLWPENSMTAFRQTCGLAVEQVEFDVHPTADSELVVHHDATIDRMTDGTGAIAAQTFAELAEFTIAGSCGDRIPRLADVLALFKPTAIDLRLEIKADTDRRRYPGLEARVAGLLADYDLLGRTTLTSFYVETLAAFREQAPQVPLIWLVERTIFRQAGGIATVTEIAQRYALGEIALHATDLDQAACEAARKAGLMIGAYAVNDEATIRRVLPLGLNAFTTNRPDIAVAVREKMGRA